MKNLSNLNPLLQSAMEKGYGVGSFSARSTFLIPYVIRAAERQKSPLIVQISANEFNWFQIKPKEFAEAFYRLEVSVPVCLHLDHTKDIDTIKDAIDAGFTSVMIDASHLSFQENVALTKQVVALAHEKGVSVEAELGNIGGADKLETGQDTTLFTKPDEALEFVKQTQVDALAVSIGTAHGVYPVKNPTIHFDLLTEIRSLIDTPLVLHGGSGLPPETVKRAILLDGRKGVSKINIATDLEQAFLAAMDKTRMLNAEINTLPQALLEKGAEAVMQVVEDKIQNFLFSANKA